MNLDKVAVSRKQISGEVPMVVAEITDGCMYSGLFGSLDSARMSAVIEKLTYECESRCINLVIIDLGNVDAIDSAIAGQIIRLGNILKLVGVSTIYCGISSILANTMVTTGVSIGDVRVERDLKSALTLSYRLSGYKLIKNAE
ncbi:anti-sigma-factor antagonist [Shewanella halifaxensis HAW-EB4]|uniref:Anti-sigma-factor antagonist n=1 Tax=Shewanella halifaxensis (strain HAW-EB4) TaxID=458817 RepID=B0TL05_SHEHH|nr:STAS domain-containing protein [Shewanella halifaxensis]ABZ77207.1 anti-sigma-factor antagonist [Shewanella halifaxensis HAW-EB4]